MSKLTGKVAVVTGASKGIGAGIATALGAEGASVVVNYASDREGAARVVAAINEKGGQAIAVQGDVSKAADAKRLFTETKATFGSLDVLVNNAGVFQFDPLEAITEDEFHREFNINVLGTILAIREAAGLFGPGGGSVINLGSIISTNPLPTSTVYSATKGAVDALTGALAKELGPRNIRVNTLAPGATETEGTHRMGLIDDGERQAQIVAQTPLGRFGQPEDIARVAVFLASDDSAWLTGGRITASGGML